jgi:hypothetical protein
MGDFQPTAKKTGSYKTRDMGTAMRQGSHPHKGAHGRVGLPERMKQGRSKSAAAGHTGLGARMRQGGKK